MTTVAWDGRSMAADTQGDFGGLRMRAAKVRRLSDGTLVGGAGCDGTFQAMADWIAQGGPDLSPKSRPAAQSDEEMSVHLIEARPDGAVFLHTRSGRTAVVERAFAVGSGGHFALAAMALGQTAAQAVELAIRLDTRSGGDVEALDLHPPAADAPR